MTELSTYMLSIARLPVLTKEAQLRHSYSIYRWMNYEGGKDAAPRHIQRQGKRSLDTMISTNLRLVVNVAKKYQGKGVDLSDLIQEGNIGLMRGMELFDPTRGYQVSTYCYWWIRQGITRAISHYSRTIRLPVNSHELICRIERYREETQRARGVQPTVEEIADFVSVTPERVRTLMEAWVNTKCASLDHKTAASDTPLGEIIPNPETSPANDPNHYIQHDTQNQVMQRAQDLLTEDEWKVIQSHYEHDMSYKSIGKDMGVNRNSVCTTHTKALKRLRLHLGREMHGVLAA